MKRFLPLAAVMLCLAAPLSAEESAPLPRDAVEALKDKSAYASQETSERVARALADLVTVHPDDEPSLLVLHNRDIITLRSRFATDTPQQRVRGAAVSFKEATQDREVPELTVRVFEEAALFIVGTTTIFGITGHDLDPLGGETLKEAAAEAQENIEQVLEEIREERSLKAILRALGLSIVATLALGLLLWMLVRLEGLALRRLAAGEKAVEKEVGKDVISETRKVTALTRLLVSLSGWAAGLYFFLVWLTFILKRFPYTRPWGEEVYGFTYGTATTVLHGIASALPSLFTVLLVFIVARILTRLVRAFFDTVERGRIRAPWVFPETAMPTRRLLVAVIWIFAFVAMYPYLPGSGSEAFRGLGVILGLMLSLGGAGVVGQAMSGLVLMYSRALRKGDYVRIADTEGVVISLGMLATKIRTIQKEEVTIPNAVVLSTSTKNYSRLAGREGVILHTTISIGYGEDWRKVHEALIEAAGKTEGLKKKPEPFVSQTALLDFYVEYKLNAYLEKPERRIPTRAALHANIQDTFNEAGITIVSPHYVNDPGIDPGVSP
jgi:small-conductance mechanosensitive channel